MGLKKWLERLLNHRLLDVLSSWGFEKKDW